MSMYIEDKTTQGYIRDQIYSQINQTEPHNEPHNDEIMGDLISRESLDSFFYSETSGTDEMIENAVMKYPDMEIEFSDDCRALCKDIIEMCRNVINTEPIAYNVEKVVEELRVSDSTELFDYKDRGATYLIPVTDAKEIIRKGGIE